MRRRAYGPSGGARTENGEWPEVGFAGGGANVLVRVPGDVARAASAVAAEFAPLETGGLVLGRYTAGRTVLTVTALLPPPPDSLHGRTDFVRGVVGLREAIGAARAEDPEVYVAGEWHTHPGEAPTPSGSDHRHMRGFTWRGLFGCRSPVLLVAGADAGRDAPWSATLYRRWRRPLPLPRSW